MTAEELKEILAENENTKVLVASLLVTATFEGKLSPITELKVCLHLIDVILTTSPNNELRQVVLDYVINEVMKIQQKHGTPNESHT